MSKREIIRKSNRPLTYNPRYYSLGSWLNTANGGMGVFDLKNTFSGSNVAGMLKGGLASSLGTVVGTVAGNTIAGGLESGAGNAIGSIGSTVGGAIGTVNPVLGGIVSAGSGIVGGIVNRAFGSKLNNERIADIEGSNKAMNNLMVDSSSMDAIESQWNNQDFGTNFSKSDIGKDGLFSNKAEKKYEALKKQQDIARNRVLTSYGNAIDAADFQSDLNAMANFAAYGGPIFEFSDMNTGKYAFGGNLIANGSEWNNGLKIIGNGGTHEENPMEGVPMGMDAEGIPNLVEQGEVIFDNYVFSNRMFADGGLLENFNLPKSYDGYSFAKIAEKLGEESKERPNDPISKRGLLSSMYKLQQAQETARQQNQVNQEGRQYSFGSWLKGLFAKEDKNTYGEYLPRAAAKRMGYEVGDDVFDYNENYRVKNPDYIPTSESTSGNNHHSDSTWLRYAPVVGSAIGLGQNLFSKPDYTGADAILEAANQAGNYTPIGYTPIGNYLQYKPLDRNFYINKLNAQAGATRRAIMNTTSPSRNATLLAADYNAQGKLGDLARQAEEYNLAQRQAIEGFNRSTNMANAEMGLKAAMANQEAALKARSSKLSGIAQAMTMRDNIDARRAASMSANLTGLFDNLGNIGIDSYNRNDRDMLINAGIFGTLSERPQDWSDEEWKKYKKAITDLYSKSKSKKGYLTIGEGGDKNG